MSFSFCLNKNELLLLSGFGLLFQGLDLNRNGKLMQDSQRLVCSVIAILERNAALGSAEFKRVACAMISVDRSSKPAQAVKASTNPGKKSEGNIEAPQRKAKAGREQLQAMASRFSTGNINTVKQEGRIERRATATTSIAKSSQLARSNTQPCISPRIPKLMQPQPHDQDTNSTYGISALDVPNLDYLSFGDDGGPTPSYPSTGGGKVTKGLNTDEFRGYLTSPPLSTPFDGFLTSADALGPFMAQSPSTFDWRSDLWTLPTAMSSQPAAQSVLSFTEEELTSGEEWSVHEGSEYRGITMPNTDGLGLEALEGNFVV